MVKDGKRAKRETRRKSLSDAPAGTARTADDFTIKEVEFNPSFNSVVAAMRKGYSRLLLMGGMRSGKTRQLMILMFGVALAPADFLPEKHKKTLATDGRTGVTIMIVRKYFKDVKRTLWVDAQTVGKQMGIWPDDGKENAVVKVNKSDLTITFKLSGSAIWFIGATEEGSGMGVSPDLTWLNEVSEIDEPFYKQVERRTTMMTFLDCNPKMGSLHWVRRTVLPGEGGPDVWVHRSTFRDNLFLAPKIRKGILAMQPTKENIAAGTADAYGWKVYGLGLFAVPEGLVFPEGKTWSFISGADVMPDEKMFPSCYCLDFGYTDWMVLGKVAIVNNDIYFDEILREKELLKTAPKESPGTDCLTKRMERLGIPKNAVIAADAADATSIEALHVAGWTGVVGIPKKRGSLRAGLDLMLARYVRVTKRSIGWQQEVAEYSWPASARRSSEGNLDDLNPVARSGDHSIDACRYGVMWLLREDGELRVGARVLGQKSIIKVKRGTRYVF